MFSKPYSSLRAENFIKEICWLAALAAQPGFLITSCSPCGMLFPEKFNTMSLLDGNSSGRASDYLRSLQSAMRARRPPAF
jgi:hypothetical protein